MGISRRIPLKTALNITVVFKAVFVFFMGYEQIGALYSTGFLALVLAAFLMEWRGWRHPPRLLVNLAASAALLTIFTRVRRNYIVEALMEALLLMIAVKMLENKRYRDYVQIVALGLGTIVCYALLSIDKTFIIYSFGMGFASTMILLLGTWFDKDESASVSFAEIRQLTARAGAIFCVMMPVCFLLFFGLPRSASPLFGTRGGYGNATTGFSDQVRLGDSGSVQTSKKLAFRAEMEELITRPYWRGVVLDIFDGNVWIASRNSLDRGLFIPDPNALRVEQQIFLEPGSRGYLFAVDHPVSVGGMETISDGDGIFRARGRDFRRRLQYNAVSAVSSQMRPLSGRINRGRYLSLPGNFMPRLAALVADVARGATDGEKISEIMRFLSSPEFTYTLDELPSGRDALERFIFEHKKGHCEYYASAMGVMLRMAGVPARLVTGYRGGLYYQVGRYYIVQEQNAHIWVEAWDEAIGAWVRHDPTPVGGAGGDDVMSALELYLDYLDYQWSKMVLNYNLEMQLDIFRNLREIIRNPRASLTPTRDGFRRIGGALSVPAAALAALAACIALFYAAVSMGSRRHDIVLLREFLRVMRRNGYHKHESEGLSEFLERVDNAPLRAAAAKFTREFEELYFKDAPIDAAARKRLKGHIDAIGRLRFRE